MQGGRTREHKLVFCFQPKGNKLMYIPLSAQSQHDKQFTFLHHLDDVDEIHDPNIQEESTRKLWKHQERRQNQSNCLSP